MPFKLLQYLRLMPTKEQGVLVELAQDIAIGFIQPISLDRSSSKTISLKFNEPIFAM